MKPTFFATQRDFRAWLEAHHASERQLLVGFYKRGTGKPSMSWPESVDEALCFGWIDGVRKSLSDEAYTIRFTPRKATSIWSAINVTRVAALESLGRMAPAGRRAFAARNPARTGVYSHERKAAAIFSPDDERRLRANLAAAAFFDAQPPWYRRTATHWVISAKRDITRARRLDQLIRDSSEGRTIGPLTRPSGSRAAPGQGEAGNSRSAGSARSAGNSRTAGNAPRAPSVRAQRTLKAKAASRRSTRKTPAQPAPKRQTKPRP
jgi:uncharacterized protein YdeI (YjbR/CyaY-like superfamily)